MIPDNTNIPDAWKWERIRNRRNELLRDTDFAMLPDAPPYTQALRDLPQTFANPDDVVFPEKPRGV